MTHIPLRDILINARQESFRMRHYYMGVEHLFIALLEIQGGLLSSLLEDYGYTTDYIIDAVRRKTGKGGRHRLWAGLPNTPRTDIVLGIAQDLAIEDRREEINERDLLLAVLEERDNIPARVLLKLGIDLDALISAANTHEHSTSTSRSYIQIDFAPDFDSELSESQLFILRRMFHGYNQIRIERRLTGGYSKAVLLIVTPIHADRREDSAVVVKIDYADRILDEAHRYDTHVKATLPPLTARLEDKPTAPETTDLAGIRYTFVANENSAAPVDLRIIAHQWGSEKLGAWLRDRLYPNFGKTWWSQRRAFRFPLWMEYDWLLPPILTLELVEDDNPPPSTPVIKDPIKRTKLHELEYGTPVIIENFTIQQVHHDRGMIQLAIGRGTEAARHAYKIEVKGIERNRHTYYRGEVIDRLVGWVYKTRDEELRHAASALEPDFDLNAEFIPGIPGIEKLPNPLLTYESLLDRYVDGSLSKSHGDLHLGNILVGPGDTPFLIDFARTHDGHTLADWAMLEVSLLSEIVMPTTGEDWRAARLVLEQVAALNARRAHQDGEAAVDGALAAVSALREVVRDCLHSENQWSEYYIGLAMCSLRAITWDTMPTASRRLMFLLTALMIYEIRYRMPSGGSVETQIDRTENISTDSRPL